LFFRGVLMTRTDSQRRQKPLILLSQEHLRKKKVTDEDSESASLLYQQSDSFAMGDAGRAQVCSCLRTHGSFFFLGPLLSIVVVAFENQ
jgi:hypothetical protein